MYITESASEQDEANPVFWLAPWAGKVGPYYCACESPIKKLSCRERVKQLLHFENKINVATKFKIFTRFHKNIVMGCQVRGCQTLKTSASNKCFNQVVVVWPQLREMHLDKDILKCIFIVQFISGWIQEQVVYHSPHPSPIHLVPVVHHSTICCFADPGSPKKVALAHKWKPRGSVSLWVTLLYAVN